MPDDEKPGEFSFTTKLMLYFVIPYLWVAIGQFVFKLRGIWLWLWAWSPVIAIIIWIFYSAWRSKYDPYYNGVNSALYQKCWEQNQYQPKVDCWALYPNSDTPH